MKGKYAFKYEGTDWELIIAPETLTMEITVDAYGLGTGGSSLQEIHGYMENRDKKEMVYFVFIPSNLDDTYNAIMAAGYAEAAATLDGIVSSVLSDATSLVKECIPELEGNLSRALSEAVDGFFCDNLNIYNYEKWSTVNYYSDLVRDIAEDMKIESDIYSAFCEMYKLVTNLANETIVVN